MKAYLTLIAFTAGAILMAVFFGAAPGFAFAYKPVPVRA